MPGIQRARTTISALGGLFGLWLAAGPALAVDPALIEAARKEGEVVWYTGMIVNQIVRPLTEAFEKKYPGIKVKAARYPSGEVVLKVLNEARAGRPQADVFDGTAVAFPLLEAGQAEPFVPEAAGAYPDAIKDPQGRWTTLNLYLMAPAINTEMVKAADAPRTYQDLLDPKWRGRIAWTNDPTMSGPPGFIGNILTIMGPDKGMAYLKQLAGQRIVNMPVSQRVVLDQVIAGEYPLALMTFNNHSVISAEQGAPVTWLKMEPIIETLNQLGLIKGGPHPNAGKLLIEFLLSEDGQNVMKVANYIPAHPKVDAKTASLKPEGGNYKVTLITPEMNAHKLAEWTAIYNELFK
jgi:ABC-type Fe3+ transport system substrate-binding protein